MSIKDLVIAALQEEKQSLWKVNELEEQLISGEMLLNNLDQYYQ